MENKRFKLIKKYPSSPEIETIVDSNLHGEEIIKEYENYPDFWEDISDLRNDSLYSYGTIIEDTYTLDYPEFSYKYVKRDDGKWYSSEQSFDIPESTIGEGKRFKVVEYGELKWRIESILCCYNGEIYTRIPNTDIFEFTSSVFNLKVFNLKVVNLKTVLEGTLDSNKNLLYEIKIHSVRRLSDGVVFTVGDKTRQGEILAFDIYGIDIKEGISLLRYRVNYRDNDWKDLLQAEKIEQMFMFISEDGVNVYEGDKVFRIDDYGVDGINIVETVVSNKNFIVYFDRVGKYFVDLAKAEEYKLWNTKCLSLQEVKNIMGDIDNKLVETVKNRYL